MSHDFLYDLAWLMASLMVGIGGSAFVILLLGWAWRKDRGDDDLTNPNSWGI